jgi:penicillin amidase
VLIGIGVAALLLVLSGFGLAYWTVQRGLPTTSGTIKFAGLSAPVTVTRDIYGVPHISAANVEDLYAAQGYVHAQDRLFQMLQLKTAGQGRLSELFGRSFVDTDRFVRTVGFRRSAVAEWEATSPEVRKGVEAYTRGVNEFLHTHSDDFDLLGIIKVSSLPLEFNILGIKMEDWEPVDTITFGKLQAWELSDSWDNDVLTADLRKKIGPERAAQLQPDYPDGGPFIVPGANSGSLLPALSVYNQNVRPNLPNFGLAELGSNNWVVDGTKSVTGKPLLSNDPHLGVRNPSVWYQVHLSTTDGKYDAVGFSFAGVPGIVTGHNKDIAWGVTNTGADVQDLFLEQLDARNHPGQYLSGDKWLPLQVLTETILVKGGDPITHTVRIVPEHGPLISDALELTGTVGSAIGTQPFSLKWTASEPGHILEAVYGLQTASNWEQFRAALSRWTVPGQNFVYADRQGNIGYQMTGEIPSGRRVTGARPCRGGRRVRLDRHDTV